MKYNQKYRVITLRQTEKKKELDKVKNKNYTERNCGMKFPDICKIKWNYFYISLQLYEYS